MKILDSGHTYEVDIYDQNHDLYLVPQNQIKFMKRIGDMYPFNEGEIQQGTNCQELIRVLIDRVKYLNHQIPCIDNDLIIEALRDALSLFEHRAAVRHGRTVIWTEAQVEDAPTCKTCGHVSCAGHG